MAQRRTKSIEPFRNHIPMSQNIGWCGLVVATLECAVDAWALDPVLRFDWS